MRTASLVFARLAGSNLAFPCMMKIYFHGLKLWITLGFTGSKCFFVPRHAFHVNLCVSWT